MKSRDKELKKLRSNIQAALEELLEKLSRFGPGSPQVEEAKKQRALRERDLYKFLDESM